jgi:hypothetical protein
MQRNTRSGKWLQQALIGQTSPILLRPPKIEPQHFPNRSQQHIEMQTEIALKQIYREANHLSKNLRICRTPESTK